MTKSIISTENTTVVPSKSHNNNEEQKDFMQIAREKGEADKIAIENSRDRSEFEKSLFQNEKGIVDFQNYVYAPVLFPLLTKEVLQGAEKKYSAYKDSLLHVLQHCYGYYYMLMTTTDKNRRKVEVKYINECIEDMNKTSNINNALYGKIIKLAWRDSGISSKRISTYGSLLNNAFTKGDLIDGKTDDEGRILPEHFSEAVAKTGGISAFSRVNKESALRSEKLKSEGFQTEGEKALELAKKAIISGEFIADIEDSKTIPIQPIDVSSELLALEDGSFAVVLFKHDAGNDDSVQPLFLSDDTAFTEPALRKFYSKLVMDSAPEEAQEVILPHKAAELRKIKLVAELLDVCGGDAEALLDQLHVDRTKMAAL